MAVVSEAGVRLLKTITIGWTNSLSYSFEAEKTALSRDYGLL
jgi:hypothetical protein